MGQPVDQSCDSCWVLGELCADHGCTVEPAEDAVEVQINARTIDGLILVAEHWRSRFKAAAAERDAYRQQATAFAQALVELGRVDIVDQAIAEAG